MHVLFDCARARGRVRKRGRLWISMGIFRFHIILIDIRGYP